MAERTVLDFSAKLKVIKTVESLYNQKAIDDQKLTLKDISERVKKVAGIEVSEFVLKQIMKEAGLKAHSSKEGSGFFKELYDMKAKFEDMEKRITALEDAVTRMK